jgi:H+-transporting ATPase
VAHRWQIILEGSTVPGEARLICAYDDPEGFEKYKRQQNSLDGNIPTEKSDEDSIHRKEAAWGSSIVAYLTYYLAYSSKLLYRI